ncbi:MAG: malate dehydrogenase, partial [Desulfovibrio sp.]|nr:malate dehydrogenase [Desulfovibrio sp.]
FYIEDKLKKEMNIPVFHDDQHGTAVITGAAFLNACEIAGRKPAECKVVVSGAGAAGIACCNFYVALGVDPKNVYMFDSKGLIWKGRTDLNQYKARYAQDKNCTLADAMKGADLFLGLSVKGLVSKDMAKSMAKDPVIFACANPEPEITYEDAKAARPDCIMGTGRTDYPNQINNVSGFPFLFRGTLDVGATEINEAMKIAAAKALAALAHEPVPASVEKAYGGQKFSFGTDYVIPKPFDPRIIEWVTPAVAKAAMDSGIATRPITDLDAYRRGLSERVKKARERAEALYKSYVK